MSDRKRPNPFDCAGCEHFGEFDTCAVIKCIHDEPEDLLKHWGPCPRCSGMGEAYGRKCTYCNGTGQVFKGEPLHA